MLTFSEIFENDARKDDAKRKTGWMLIMISWFLRSRGESLRKRENLSHSFGKLRNAEMIKVCHHVGIVSLFANYNVR